MTEYCLYAAADIILIHRPIDYRRRRRWNYAKARATFDFFIQHWIVGYRWLCAGRQYRQCYMRISTWNYNLIL